MKIPTEVKEVKRMSCDVSPVAKVSSRLQETMGEKYFFYFGGEKSGEK